MLVLLNQGHLALAVVEGDALLERFPDMGLRCSPALAVNRQHRRRLARSEVELHAVALPDGVSSAGGRLRDRDRLSVAMNRDLNGRVVNETGRQVLLLEICWRTNGRRSRSSPCISSGAQCCFELFEHWAENHVVDIRREVVSWPRSCGRERQL